MIRKTLLSLILTLAACGGGGSDDGADPDKPPPPPSIPNLAAVPAQTSLNCPNGTFLTYENFGRAFMLTYCNSCHTVAHTGAARGGAPDGMDFDTPEQVLVWRAAIMTDTLVNVPPPSASSGGTVAPTDDIGTGTATDTGTSTGTGTATGTDTGTATSTATGTGSGTGTGTSTATTPAKMPPVNDVAPLDLQGFSEWMNCGAPVANGKAKTN